MDASDDVNTVCFSLVRGGPFHRLLHALHLARDDARDPVRQAVALVSLSWVPLVALALLQRLATGRWASAILLDPAVHARLLVAVPLLLVAERAMGLLCARCIDRFVQSDLVPDGRSAVPRVLVRAARLRDAGLPELALAVAAIAPEPAKLWGHLNWLESASAPGAAAGSSLADLYWVVVSLPVAQFLLYRSLWRWGIWWIVLSGLARLDVRPAPLHPDRCGGLAFLAEPVLAFAVVVMAIDSFVAGAWGGQMLYHGQLRQSYALPFSEIHVASFALAFAPLFAFTRCLGRARFAALREYDRFALTYARSFHEKWIRGGRTEGLLGTPDIQSMADLGHALAIVRRMRVVPVGGTEILALVVAIWIPVTPLFLATIPLHELLRRSFGAFFAGLPR